MLTTSNYTSYCATANHSHSNYASSSHTHDYLSLSSGGTVVGNITSKTSFTALNTAHFYANTGTSQGVGGFFYAKGNNTYLVANNSSSTSYLKLMAINEIQLQTPSSTDSSWTWVGMRGKSFTNDSSIKYKKNIHYMDDKYAYDLLKLKPVIYDYINENNGVNCLGLIAEDVYKYLTYPVICNDNNEPDGIDYSRFVSPIIKLLQIHDNRLSKIENFLLIP